MPASPDRRAEIRVDRIACSSHGICAGLLPRDIQLDEWGYPVIANAAVDPAEGETAIGLCPARALYLAGT